MSGVIELSDTEAWVVAGWAFDEVMRLMNQQTHVVANSQYAARLQKGLDNELQFLSLQGWGSEEMQWLSVVLQGAYVSAETTGPRLWSSPEFFEGFMERFRELLKMIANRTASLHAGRQ